MLYFQRFFECINFWKHKLCSLQYGISHTRINLTPSSLPQWSYPISQQGLFLAFFLTRKECVRNVWRFNPWENNSDWPSAPVIQSMTHLFQNAKSNQFQTEPKMKNREWVQKQTQLGRKFSVRHKETTTLTCRLKSRQKWQTDTVCFFCRFI